MGEYIEACKTTEYRDGTIKKITVPAGAILVARINDNYHAVSNRCTHLGGDLSAGTLDAEGSWHLEYQGLSGLRLVPPEHHSGKHLLTVKSVTERPDGSKVSVSQTLPLEITGVVDTPMLRLSAERGYEDRPVALDIKAGLADTDGSEVLDLEVSAVPVDAVISAGAPLGAGPWRLSAGDLERLTLIPPEDWSGQAVVDSIQQGDKIVSVKIEAG